MEAVSEVILRNERRLPEGPLLLVNPARDTMARQLQREGRSARCLTQDFGDYRWLQSTHADVTFGAMPVPDCADRAIILRLPREKELLNMVLHAVAERMAPAAILWLVGENRAGIKSAPRHMRHYFQRVTVVDNARHCGLLEASGPAAIQPFDLDQYMLSWTTHYAGREIQLRSLPGVFAHGRLDRGSALLLEVLERIRSGSGRKDGFWILPAAAGLSGPPCSAATNQRNSHCLTLPRWHSNPAGRPSPRMACALRYCHRTGWPNSTAATTGSSGVASDLEVAAGFFRRAGTFLAENGRIVIVFNRHLPYFRWLKDSFEHVERLAESEEFTVIQANRSARRSGGGR